ncbi:MAG TPA: hypothetical protein VGL94_12705 [Ktedonobacteraceae bacterium]
MKNTRSLLIEAALSLLILSAIVTAFMSTPQAAHAQIISKNCAHTSQNYPYSQIWPSVGPELLKQTNQELTVRTGNTAAAQQIYPQLISTTNCSLATLLQKKYKVLQAYDLEKHILVTALPSPINSALASNVSRGLTWIMSQNSQKLVDSWISSAILSNINNISSNIHNTLSTIHSFSNTDYMNALNIFCNVFQHDTTTYLYGSATPVHIQTMVLDLRNGAGNSVSALALGLEPGTNPQSLSPNSFEKQELEKAQQMIDQTPTTITPCPGSESLTQAKPALDDFVMHKLSTFSISDLDSFFSQAALFNPADQGQQ